MNINLTKYCIFICLFFPVACKNIDSGSEIKQAVDVRDNYTTFKNDKLPNGNTISDYVTTFYDLPFFGAASGVPWTNTYWPSNLGGITYRWNSSEYRGCTGQTCFSYTPPTLASLKSNPSQITSLSPAEKFSIYIGDYNYSLVDFERKYRLANGWELPSWEGICHGWAPASINYIEPKRVVMPANSDGLQVEFGSADVKALLSYNQGEGIYSGNNPSLFVAPRCTTDFSTLASDRGALAKIARTKECRGINPADLHLVLANHIGKNKKSFVADVTADEQVWNQPVYGFRSYILGINGPSGTSAAGAVKEVEMLTFMRYTAEIDAPQAEAFGAHNADYSKSKVYRYKLEIGEDEKILGGEYIVDLNTTNEAAIAALKNGDIWPDFMWVSSVAPFGKTGFTYGDRTKLYSYDMSKLQEIYNAAIK